MLTPYAERTVYVRIHRVTYGVYVRDIRTGVCTTEYHTIFYHSFFMSQVYIMDYYWFFGKVFPVVFLPVGVLRLDLAYSSISEA